MTSSATVLASLTRAVIDFGVSRGLSADRLLRVASLTPEDLARRDGRLPRSAEGAVWKELASAFGPYGTGLDFAATAPGPRAYGVIALRDMTSATFGEALRRHCRHHRVIKDDVSALLLETPSSATVFLGAPSRRHGGLPAMAEASLAPYAVHARAWTGMDVNPEEVRFEHPAPPDPEPYERLFRCPVRFGQSVTCIRFGRDVLDLPLLHAQEDVCDFLDASAAEALARLAGSDLAELVYRAVAEQLGQGDVTVGGVARALGLGVRTLQRRLRQEGVCFQDVVDAVRHHRALDVLQDPTRSIAQVSEHLGFSDPRAFRRAFARWTGMSPDRYRRVRAAREVA